MFARSQKFIGMLMLTASVSGFLLFPMPADARVDLRKFGNWLKKRVEFVVNSPNKITRPLGPVLGPIAANIISGNLASHHKFGQLFSRLQKAEQFFDNIDEQKKVLAELRQMYQNQADSIREQVKTMEEAKDKLSQELARTGMTFAEYEEKFIAINDVIKAYEAAAEKFETAGNRLSLDDVVKLAGNKALKFLLGEIKNAVLYETGEEIKRFFDPDLVKNLIEKGNSGVDGILDMLISGDIDRALDRGNISDIDIAALRDRVRNRIKEIIENNKEDLKNNWQSKLDEVIQQMIKDIKEGNAVAEETDSEEEQAEADEEETPVEKEQRIRMEAGMIPVDEHGCKPGYIHKPNMGISCVQENCNDVPDGHWSYEGYCVCGSSGSMYENPEDPNMECVYPINYSACPGCLYACVHPGEDCPEY